MTYFHAGLMQGIAQHERLGAAKMQNHDAQKKKWAI
jgi:hypothetical protein